jgi:hypothetical protein
MKQDLFMLNSQKGSFSPSEIRKQFTFIIEFHCQDMTFFKN